MAKAFPVLLRDIHRLRKHIHEIQTELDDAPRRLRIRGKRLANQELEIKQATESLKHLKAAIGAQELTLKSHHQQLAKYQKQLGEMTTERESKAKQAEIDFTEAEIRALEEDSLRKITELDTRTADLPRLQQLLVDAQADFKTFEKELTERLERLKADKHTAENQLAKVEKDLPDTIRGDYDRIVKAYGADALSAVKERACQQCHNAITGQQQSDLGEGTFMCCRNCGRALYPI